MGYTSHCIECHESFSQAMLTPKCIRFRRNDVDIKFDKCYECHGKNSLICTTHFINSSICLNREVNSVRDSFMNYLLCLDRMELNLVLDIRKLIWQKIMTLVGPGKCITKTMREIDASFPNRPMARDENGVLDLDFTALYPSFMEFPAAHNADFDGDEVNTHVPIPNIRAVALNRLRLN